MKNKFLSAVFIFGLLFTAELGRGGVGHGNPKVKFTNTVYNYQIEYSITEFQLQNVDNDLVKIVGLLDPQSFLNISAHKTALLTLEQLQKEENLQNCRQGSLNGVSGFECDGRIALLVPGVQVVDFHYSSDAQIKSVLNSFKYFIYDRLPIWDSGFYDFEPGYDWTKMLALVDNDQNLAFQSPKRLTVRKVKDMSLSLEIPLTADNLTCNVHAASMRVACAGYKHLFVWSLQSGQLIWHYNDPNKDFNTPFFVDGQTIVVAEHVQNYTVQEYKIGSNQPVQKVSGVVSIKNFFYLGGVPYLFVDTGTAAELINYQNLQLTQTFQRHQRLEPIPHENKLLGQLYVHPNEEITKFDPLTQIRSWTIYLSYDQTSGSSVAIGSDFFTLNDLNGNLRTFNLATGEMRTEFMETDQLGYSGIGTGSYSFLLGKDGKTFYRKGPSDVSFSRLEKTTQTARIVGDAPFFFPELVHSKLLVVRQKEFPKEAVYLYSPFSHQFQGSIKMSYFETVMFSPTPDLSSAYTTDGSKLSQYDLTSGNKTREVTLPMGSSVDPIAAYSNDEVVFEYNKSVLLMNMKTKTSKIWIDRLPSNETIDTMTLSPAGKTLVLHNRNSIFTDYYVYDINGKKPLYTGKVIKNGKACNVFSAKFKSEDVIVLSTSGCGTYVRQLRSDKNLMEYPDDAIPSPSGKYYGDLDLTRGVVRIYDTQSGKKINELWGHTDNECQYSAVGSWKCKGTKEFLFLDDDTVITTGGDATIRFWRTVR